MSGGIYRCRRNVKSKRRPKLLVPEAPRCSLRLFLEMENSTTPALHTDRYELTMLNAALGDGTSRRRAVFEMFARFLPGRRSFGIVAGIERAIDAIQGFC